MRAAMARMEQERLEMAAEVEAQIKRALASMQVEILSDVSEYSDDSRPDSRMSDIPTISRRTMGPGNSEQERKCDREEVEELRNRVNLG